MARKKAKVENAGKPKLVRRNVKTGEIEARRPGRPHPDFEPGYLDESGDFQAGNPGGARRGRRRRRGGRRAAPVAEAASVSVRQPRLEGGLREIELLVQREVESRLQAARAAAVEALTRALSL